MAYGHKDIPHPVELLTIENPARELVLADLEARRLGLRWKRRRGVARRLGFDPLEQTEEDDEQAVEQGHQMRQRLRDRINQVPDIPDHLPPPDLNPRRRSRSVSPENQTPRPLKRVRMLEEDSDPDDSLPLSAIQRPRSPVAGTSAQPLRIDSDGEEAPPPVRRPRAKRRGHRRSRNAFVLSEAEEEPSEGEQAPEHSSTRVRSDSSSSDSSNSSSDSNDSFVVDDGCVD